MVVDIKRKMKSTLICLEILKNPTTLDGRCIDKNHPSPNIREPLSEIPMADLQKIDKFADKKLNAFNVVITDKHFFDRLNDRNGKEISSAELIDSSKDYQRRKGIFRFLR